jgi:hypothetical protein
MDANTVFALANTTALVAWIVLILFQRKRWATDFVVTAAASLFAAAYVALLGPRWFGSTGGFDSLEGVAALFSDRWLLLAGWVHYLAFDLLVGRWEARDAAARGISAWLMAPILYLTFMFGPAGWLAYLLVRLTHARGVRVQSPTRSATPSRIVHSG